MPRVRFAGRGREAVIAYMRENRRLILNILRSVNGEKLLDNLYRSAQSIVLSALENHPGVQELSRIPRTRGGSL